MLKKLIKYDLKDAFNKVILIYATLALTLAGAYRLFSLFSEIFLWEIVAKICFGACISMAVTLIINVVIHAWVNFSLSVYSDRGYLTHTLPIKKSTIYTSKVLSSMICLLISVLIAGIAIFILLYSDKTVELYKQLSIIVNETYEVGMVALFITIAIEIFFQTFALIQAGWVGIILGQRMQNGKRGFSFLFGAVTYIIFQWFAVVGILIASLFKEGMLKTIFTASDVIEVGVLKILLIGAIVIYAIIDVLAYLIAIKLFNKGVNLE